MGTLFACLPDLDVPPVIGQAVMVAGVIRGFACGVVSIAIFATTGAAMQCGDRWAAAALKQGEEHVYGFDALQGQHIVFETFQDAAWPRPVNTQVTLIDASSGAALASNNDKAFGDVFSRLAACIPADGGYEVRVGVWPGAWPGAYEASFNCAAPFRHHDDCTDSGEYTCGPLFYENDSRCLSNDFDPLHDGCSGFAATGGDAVLGLRVEAGWALEVSLVSTADAVVYLVADCQDIRATCIAAADRGLAGEAEHLRHQFADGGLWYLILDHHGNGQGDLTLTGSLSCEPVAIDQTSWTQVRRLFRE